MRTTSTACAVELPTSVQRYFDIALPRGSTNVHSAELLQEGEFLLRPRAFWRPFTATHRLTMAPPRFTWDARIRVMPGISVRVHDAFINGIGSMRATLGLFTLVSMTGTPEITVGALQRYLAEAAWCPPALLPDNGVEWTPIDASTARAAVSTGRTRVTLDFHFGPHGLIERVYAASRPRVAGREIIGTPWQAHFRQYAERDNLVIPLAGEVEWLLPEGALPYWRGHITRIRYRRR